MRDKLLGQFVAEPFNGTPEQFGKLTSRELWEWYFAPAIERGKRMEQRAKGETPAVNPENDPTGEKAFEIFKGLMGGGK